MPDARRHSLPASELRRQVTFEDIEFADTSEIDDIDRIIGQDRAVNAVRFGIGIESDGYNIFAVGDEATGKHSLIREFLEKEAGSRPVPDDWCYVNNFEDPQRPKAIRMPAGRAAGLKTDIGNLIDEMRAAIRAAFESEDFQARRHTLETELKQQPEEQLEQLDERAKERGVTLMRTPRGMAFAPYAEGDVLSPEQYEALPEDRQKELEAVVEEMQEDLQKVLSQVPRWEREMTRRVRDLTEGVARDAATEPIEMLKAKYEDLPAVQAHLDAVLGDIVENVGNVLQSDGEDEQGQGLTLPGPLGEDPVVRRYGVNVLIDHSESEGAPVVYEDHPTYSNLMGRIERTVIMGAVITDFQMIQPGCFHQANGGYLMLDALRLLQQPMAWEGLKRTLRAEKVRIESLEQTLSLASTVTLEPEPIPLQMKVALLGDSQIYHMLSTLDPDFDELFKVQADFGEEMDADADIFPEYVKLVASLARREELRPLSKQAVGRVLEESLRMTSDQKKLSTEVHAITDLLRESSYWAGEAGRDVVSDDDVERAVTARIHRSDRIREHLHEAIGRDTIVIQTEGEEVGQINGLSVVQVGRFAFGRPSRITARVSIGDGDLVDIEREVELSGPFHSKGVMILAGYLKSEFAQNHPLSLSASLVFEQSYSGVDGDSASSAELYALLSAIAEVPLTQSIAVTGSVSQRGQVQAIGGVNEKIEGFFDVCQARGLTGDQGVMIPLSNVEHLMLRQDVVDAVEEGKFAVYAVEDVKDGIELLTGLEAGSRQPDGTYPAGTFNAKVDARLTAFAETRREFARSNNGTEDQASK